MPQIDISVEVPPLPEGFAGSPDELFEFFKENSTFSFDGNFPTGQIGGARPTADSGIWYGDTSIEKFRAGSYHTITDVPIGALIPWASQATVPPDNYLLADGRSLARDAYPDLFTVIGVTWGSESVTTFNLPDLRGRVPVGAGIGDYIKQGIIGRMAEVTSGSYFGFEWPRLSNLPPNAPVKSMQTATLAVSVKNYANITPPAVGINWLIRTR